MSKFIGEPSMLGPVSNKVEDYAGSNGPLSKAGPGSNTEGYTQEGQCVRCQAMKIKCRGLDENVCDPCHSIPYECCIRLEHLFPPFTSPDLYTDLDVFTIECLGSSKKTPLRRRAQIFLCSRMDKRNIFLACEVDVYRLKFSDPSHSVLTEIRLWEDMRSPGTEKQLGCDQVLSCSLIPGSLPSKQIIRHWILESARTNPSGVIGGFQGPLFKCVTCYIRDAYRPMHELVVLALIHTSLYNVCHSKLAMMLENQHDAVFRVCPRLRAEVFAPLFLETGQELLAKLKEAVKDFRQSVKEQHLPLCLVIWMLMLIYLHCDAQTEKATSAFASINSVSSIVVDKKNSWFTPDLEMRQANTRMSINTIKLLHKALFKRMGKPIGPILDTKFRIMCNKCKYEGQSFRCDHNNELEIKLSALRRAVWLQQTRTEPWPNGPHRDMDEVIGRLPQNYEEPDLTSCDDEENQVIAPLPSENTPSTSERLVSDVMSVGKK